MDLHRIAILMAQPNPANIVEEHSSEYDGNFLYGYFERRPTVQEAQKAYFDHLNTPPEKRDSNMSDCAIHSDEDVDKLGEDLGDSFRLLIGESG